MQLRSQKEAEISNERPTSKPDNDYELRPSLKRKITSRMLPNFEDQGTVQDHEEKPPKKRLRFSETETQKAIRKPLPSDGHIVLASELDSHLFFYMLYYPGTNMAAIRNLEIRLDATKIDEYADYRLALALTELHPRHDGTNPHMIQSIKLVVNGNLLFMRHRYHISSGAAFNFVKKNIKRFLAGNLSVEKENDFLYSCTESVVARALLGIRGIEKVLIGGKGKMEEGFAETLRKTLIQPPGVDTAKSKGNKKEEPSFAAKGLHVTAGGFIDMLEKAEKENLPLVIMGEEDAPEIGWKIC